MPQKASTPWSTRTVAEGGTDSPVGDLVPIPDKITPVVNTGFISLAGKYRGIPSDDLAFKLSNYNEAIAAGASMFVDPVDMMEHNVLILGLLDSSGNTIDVDIDYVTGGAVATGPYASDLFSAGIGGGNWKQNLNETGGSVGALQPMVSDTSETLAATWSFYRLKSLSGTAGMIKITSNEGSDAGQLSAAYLRLV